MIQKFSLTNHSPSLPLTLIPSRAKHLDHSCKLASIASLAREDRLPRSEAATIRWRRHRATGPPLSWRTHPPGECLELRQKRSRTHWKNSTAVKLNWLFLQQFWFQGEHGLQEGTKVGVYEMSSQSKHKSEVRLYHSESRAPTALGSIGHRPALALAASETAPYRSWSLSRHQSSAR